MDHHEKLAWSAQHLHALDLEIEDFIKRHPFTGRGEQEGNSRRFGILADDYPLLPPHWPLMVGDAIHNLRGALDHMIWALSLRSKTPPSVDDSTKILFPICTKEEWYIGKPKMPQGGARWKCARFIGDEALAIVDGCQPYRGVYPVHEHPLAVIAAYSNHDKHRNLVASAALAQPVQFTFKVTAHNRQGVIKPATITQTQQWFYKDAKLGVVEFAEGTTCDPGEMEVRPVLEGTVAFGKEGPERTFDVTALEEISYNIRREIIVPLDAILCR